MPEKYLKGEMDEEEERTAWSFPDDDVRTHQADGACVTQREIKHTAPHYHCKCQQEAFLVERTANVNSGTHCKCSTDNVPLTRLSVRAAGADQPRQGRLQTAPFPHERAHQTPLASRCPGAFPSLSLSPFLSFVGSLPSRRNARNLA
eukprot:616561-Rhodomonas_salina.4